MEAQVPAQPLPEGAPQQLAPRKDFPPGSSVAGLGFIGRSWSMSHVVTATGMETGAFWLMPDPAHKLLEPVGERGLYSALIRMPL